LKYKVRFSIYLGILAGGQTIPLIDPDHAFMDTVSNLIFGLQQEDLSHFYMKETLKWAESFALRRALEGRATGSHGEKTAYKLRKAAMGALVEGPNT
jgi:hypothetical protein